MKNSENHGLRVLLVDDSPTVRAVLQRILRRTADVIVVGEAEDGEAGVRLALELAPDIVLMDLAMPRVDGFVATAEIMHRAPTAILVFSSDARVDGRRIFDAYSRGARAVLPKPASPEGWTELSETLPELIRNVVHDFENSRPGAAPVSGATDELDLDLDFDLDLASALYPIRYLAIGASTGGPEALRELLTGLAPRPPMTVLVVQHIAAEFERGLADWLRADLSLDVRLAEDGEVPDRGAVRLAPQGVHLRLEEGGRLSLDPVTPPVSGHRPSADVLLESCAAVSGRLTAGILLSGMGKDGVAGLGKLRQAGSLTLVQDRASSVVYGMPQAALAAGAAELALPPSRLAGFLLRAAGESS